MRGPDGAPTSHYGVVLFPNIRLNERIDENGNVHSRGLNQEQGAYRLVWQGGLVILIEKRRKTNA